MTDETTAAASLIYLVKIHGKDIAVARDFHGAMERIGVHVAGSQRVMRKWRTLGEFPGLDTEELSGSFYHRIRYAIANLPDEYVIDVHCLDGAADRPTLVSQIKVQYEFDPAYQLQAALNRVAEGLCKVEDGVWALMTQLRDSLSFKRSIASDEDIVAQMRETHRRMEGHDFCGADVAEATKFLDELPSLVCERFEQLAREAFPSPSMAI